MYCYLCGKEIADDVVFCSYCGQRQQPLKDGQNTMAGTVGPVQAAKKMEWYKFIIYFQLYASAAVAVIMGCGVMAFMAHGKYTDRVYTRFALLEAVDMIFAVLLFLTAIFALYVRYKLAGLKKNAVKWYLAFLGAIEALLFAYVFAVSGVIGAAVIGLANRNLYIAIGSVACLILINAIYFKKRRHLFVN